jgi:NAD(P)-dependent dehydrogenase (short-subunit alcohol dehydrogenase family)
MLDARVAITGGAGGLGGRAARHLAAQGARVAPLDLPSDGLAALTAELGAPDGAVDVRDENSVRDAFARIADAWGGLDALVVAAGIQLIGSDAPAGEVPIDVWDRTLAVNLTGAFLCVKHALPLLAAQPSSSIVLIGSPTGLTMSGAGGAAYAASKAGMMSLGRTVAADYAHAGVRANVVVPGTMRTPLIADLLADDATHRALLAGLPIGRLGEPEDLDGVIEWLVSPSSAFATGAFFAVDGGLTAR